MNKQKWLDIAEVLDAHRIFPKLSMSFAWTCAAYVGYWYMTLPDPTSEQSAFAVVVAGALAKSQDYYFQGGRKWVS